MFRQRMFATTGGNHKLQRYKFFVTNLVKFSVTEYEIQTIMYMYILKTLF